MRRFEIEQEIKEAEERRNFFQNNGMIELVEVEEKLINTLKSYLN